MNANEQSPVLSGRVIKAYRIEAELTQEKLAELVDLQARTIGAYEREERWLTNVQTARKIMAVLHIPSAESRLNEITPAVFDDPDKTFDEIWQRINTADFVQARSIVLALCEHLRLGADDRRTGKKLAYACFLAGHIEAILCPAHKVDQALAYFEAIERYAHGDHTLMNLSLTYRGDMLRRKGNIASAIDLLEQAWATTPGASLAVKGNNQQLLARAYFHKRDEDRFEAAISRSIGLAEAVATSGIADTMRVSYTIHTVYEEHARNLAKSNKIKRSLLSLDKAESVLPNELRWQMNLKATRGEVLIRKAVLQSMTSAKKFVLNDDFQEGVLLLGTASEMARQSGHNRLLTMIGAVPRYLSQKSLSFLEAADMLHDAIDKKGIPE